MGKYRVLYREIGDWSNGLNAYEYNIEGKNSDYDKEG
jgi:hypothetical protein